MSSDKTPTRNDYVIDIQSGELAKAAQRLHDYHADRYAWWSDERDNAEEAVKEAGVTVQSYQQTGGDRRELKGDPQLINRMAEAEQKMTTHANQRDEYQHWAAFFGYAGKTWPVTPTDFRYFDLGQTVGAVGILAD